MLKKKISYFIVPKYFNSTKDKDNLVNIRWFIGKKYGENSLSLF